MLKNIHSVLIYSGEKLIGVASTKKELLDKCNGVSDLHLFDFSQEDTEITFLEALELLTD